MQPRLLIAAALLIASVVAGSLFVTLNLLGSDDDEYRTSRAMVRAGERAPSFELEGSDGRAVSLGQYQGKKNVLLYFSMGYG